MAYITFIIPTVGRHSLIRALNSLHDLKDHDWKAIVVFDGLKNEIVQPSDKIKIVEAPQTRSPGLTRNYGMAMVDTKWIGFLDDDDCLYEDYIGKLKEEEHNHPEAEFVLFRMIADKIVPRMTIKDAILINEVGISFAIKNSTVIKHDAAFEKKGSEDYNFLKNLSLKGVKFRISNYVAYEVCRNNRDKEKK